MFPDHRPDLAEADLIELEDLLVQAGAPRFHARQLFQWIYRRGITEFNAMTDLGRELRARLTAGFRIYTPTVERREQSSERSPTPSWRQRFKR